MEGGDYSHPDVLQSVGNDRYHSWGSLPVFPRCGKPGKRQKGMKRYCEESGRSNLPAPWHIWGGAPLHYPFLKGGEMKTSIRWGISVAVAVFLYTRPNPLWLLIYTIGIITLLAREFDR